jgi:DNA polymerase-1
VTIDCHVPLELNLAAMETQQPDIEACRELFTELEFTSMLRDLAPSEVGPAIELLDAPTEEQVAAFYAAARENGFAFALDAKEPEAAEEEEEAQQPMNFSLLDAVEEAERKTRSSIGVCAQQGTACALRSRRSCARCLRMPRFLKAFHDWKLALHVLSGLGVNLRGAVDDTMLLSYALNPTHATQALADVAARHGQCAPASLPAAAAALHALVPVLRAEVDKTQVERVYRDIDLPLAPVLFRMEQAGVRIDKGALDGLSKRFSVELERVGERIFELAGQRFNINSPKQLGVVLFTHLGCPRLPAAERARLFPRRRMCWRRWRRSTMCRGWCLNIGIFPSSSRTTLMRCHLLADAESRVHTTFQAAATATGRLSSVNPNLQNIPIRTELGREIRAAFTAAPGTQLLSADYSQIELRLLAHFSGDPLLTKAYAENIDIHTMTASEVFGVPIENMDKETRGRAKAVNFGIVYGISAFGLAAQLGIPQSEAKAYIERYFARYQGVQRLYRTHVGADAPGWLRAHAVWAGAADSGHREPQRKPAGICRAYGR